MPTKELVNVRAIERFITTMKLPSSLARALLKCPADCEEFLLNFHRTHRYAADDLLEYKEVKIARSGITLADFLMRCHCEDLPMKTVFEETFFDQFAERDMEIISQAIFDQRTSLTQLFINFQQNPHRKIMRYVL